MKDVLRFFQLPKSKIVELNYVLAGYEGMGVVRTVDAARGIIEIIIAPDFEPGFNELFSKIAPEFQMTEVPRPEGGDSISDEAPLEE